ncbi:NADPH-dependent FMN reductase [Algiphilus sp.]|uniref:NADPH-dependent FMN reductase n=1 Tax=Algiphilus sp. TaxID=1872431 RepID=UPI003B52523E
MKVLCLSGSARAASFNTALLEVAAAELAARDIDVMRIAPSDLRALPLMDQDLESASGLPEQARALKASFHAADGIVWACPEYNGSVTPLLKNVIDWVSRPDDALPAPACFQRRPMALLAASPGGLGGLRGLRHVREILGNLSAMVVPRQFALAKAGDAFDAQGALRDSKNQEAVAGVMDDLLFWMQAIHGKG